MSSWSQRNFCKQSSTSSDESSCLDPSYATVDVEANRLIHSSQGQKGFRPCCSLAAVSLILSIICLLLLLVGGLLFFILYADPGHGFRERKVLSDQERICIPCDQIQPNPLTEAQEDGTPLILLFDVHVDSRDGDTKQCCASTLAQYTALFKLILRRQEEVKKVADTLGNDVYNDTDRKDVISARSASAHLLAKPSYEADTNIQHWKSADESPMSHVRGGLRFNKHTVTVQTPGIYFIYCQILYNRAPARNSGSQEDPADGTGLASHYVRRHSALYPASSAILLKARHSRNMGQDDRHSSYVGGLFSLHSGDQLYVQVSVPELVSHDDLASFFGLFSVGV